MPCIKMFKWWCACGELSYTAGETSPRKAPQGPAKSSRGVALSFLTVVTLTLIATSHPRWCSPTNKGEREMVRNPKEKDRPFGNVVRCASADEMEIAAGAAIQIPKERRFTFDRVYDEVSTATRLLHAQYIKCDFNVRASPQHTLAEHDAGVAV